MIIALAIYLIGFFVFWGLSRHYNDGSPIAFGLLWPVIVIIMAFIAVGDWLDKRA